MSAASLAAAALCAAVSAKRNRQNRILRPLNLVFGGAFLAVFIGLVPIFAVMLAGQSEFVLKLCMLDALQTLQAFTINIGADFILDNINETAGPISGMYATYMTCLFFLAPVLTFGFLASLFKNALAGLNYRFHYRKDVCAFSELNENSLKLAQSLRKQDRKTLIAFTDVDREEGGISGELLESAKAMGAVLFQKDIVAAGFMKHSPRARITFFAINEKERDNLILALKLIEIYRNRKNTDLYVFSTGTEGELLLSGAPKGEVRVRRVNEIRSLIYQFLYDEGNRLFETAAESEENKKEIRAVIAGLGRYGTEMLRSLTWFSQMDGYTVRMDAYDLDELAEERFSALCPELMSEQYNGVIVPGESEYTIRIHSGIDVRTSAFVNSLKSLPKPTFVFVALGDDAESISQAANIRMLCERFGSKPMIKTVVTGTDEKEALSGITNFKGQPYDIETIGDLASAYSAEILVGSKLENAALARHLKWGSEEEFWQYEYNYRSSIASAVHMKARIACGISGADKAEDALTEEERDVIERLEHRRWNAYMRSEGYVYSGSPDKSSRNDLAKTHHNLVDFSVLTEEDKRKDSQVGTV